MADNPQLRAGDLNWIAKVRATNGGGFPSEFIPKAKLRRLLSMGAIRYKSIGGKESLSTPDEVWKSRAAQHGYVIHGPNADAMLAEREKRNV
jgi:hypothetical protein